MRGGRLHRAAKGSGASCGRPLRNIGKQSEWHPRNPTGPIPEPPNPFCGMSKRIVFHITFLHTEPTKETHLGNIGKQSKSGPRGIRRVRSRNPQSHCVKCLKVLDFIVLLHSLRRGATNQAKSIGKRNDFTFPRNSSKYFLDDFRNSWKQLRFQYFLA